MASRSLHRSAAWLKRMLPTGAWRPLRAVSTALVTPLRFSFVTGHWQSSIASSARSPNGQPLPWYTYPAIDFLTQRDFRQSDVLEFGGGQSTLWWSARARSVFTIERDAKWVERLRPSIGSNVRLHHIPVNAGAHSMQPVWELLANDSRKSFDIIVVDGHLRQQAAAFAFECLAPGGAIILDNAEGYGFYEEIRMRNCRRVDFFGFAPGVTMRHCTSIVFVDDCFLFQPDIPIPEIDPRADSIYPDSPLISELRKRQSAQPKA